MSFSSEVKKELLTHEYTPCCNHARNYGLLLFGRSFSSDELSLLTENEDIANVYCEAVTYFSGKVITPTKTDGGKFKVSVKDKQIISTVFDKLAISSSPVKRKVNLANLAEPCCFSSFISGAFLSCGTVTDPQKEYHLEFSVASKTLAEDLVKIFDEYEPVPKITQRSGSYTVYFKNSTDIEDVLSIIGATESSLAFMGTKVYKDIRNTVNRKVNFESANLARTIAAATKQYEAIVTVKNKIGLDALPEELREIAQLRLEDRQLSNSEISKMLSESLTVSGVNHRFKRIIKIAEELEK